MKYLKTFDIINENVDDDYKSTQDKIAQIKQKKKFSMNESKAQIIGDEDYYIFTHYDMDYNGRDTKFQPEQMTNIVRKALHELGQHETDVYYLGAGT